MRAPLGVHKLTGLRAECKLIARNKRLSANIDPPEKRNPMSVDTDDEYYRLGLEQESPADFLHFRREWLADPDSVRLQQTSTGGWDIVLRIDGTYLYEAEAREIADTFQREIYGLAEQIRRAVHETRAQR